MTSLRDSIFLTVLIVVASFLLVGGMVIAYTSSNVLVGVLVVVVGLVLVSIVRDFLKKEAKA
jgi:hypothetical protein